MSRRTFVVHVYGDGPSMVEDLGTQERAPVPNLAAPAHQATTRTVGRLSARDMRTVAEALLTAQGKKARRK